MLVGNFKVSSKKITKQCTVNTAWNYFNWFLTQRETADRLSMGNKTNCFELRKWNHGFTIVTNVNNNILQSVLFQKKKLKSVSNEFKAVTKWKILNNVEAQTSGYILLKFHFEQFQRNEKECEFAGLQVWKNDEICDAGSNNNSGTYRINFTLESLPRSSMSGSRV